jgi:eukaryotic translation initiation factor 2C
MLTVPGRILSPPKVNYKGDGIFPRDGSWNMAGKKFSQGAVVKDWTFLRLKQGRDPLQQTFGPTIAAFSNSMGLCGVSSDGPKPPGGYTLNLDANDDTNRVLLEREFERIKNGPTKMLLVVLPRRQTVLYGIIKYLGDVKFGIHTVCVVADKIGNTKGQEMYMANIALKFNLKRGGRNQSLADDKLGLLKKKPTIVFGIDVTHPSPDSASNAPSIAGLVASIDQHYAQWPASIRTQEGRKEMVSSLTDMIIERMRVWQAKNGQKLPEQILIYRDGVSEGQYESVLREEYPCFLKACEKLYTKGPKPKIAIVIVGKRHHTRFYPTDEKGMDNKAGNPKNGTVVDRGVTMERHWDFYLQAHTGLQGQARPAHYVVIKDDIGLGADGLEQLVSLPPIRPALS